ncbi:similar to UBA/TS-N domain-containing protein [Plenodomus lingam JN3]|uniref:Similar to UBA/TS-N domain-containing protein n=1 Tax=Leptosphaeria maculans (strain JN3 / isolate v23.1.3 / race Av1-4-5-6-7-8) TaxID=985895 RepID=E5A9G5_LEPMJ|nr:similar to UBA/TS-N domain-containing protein [Plenodomus lingam JN3]CBY00306.1 similar to UBA/TS-N domain-containing protein [Plenodomus lingam JN3]
MDDLAGLDWSQPAKRPAHNTPTTLPPFRQSPTPQLSGRSTPQSTLSVPLASSRVSPANANSQPFKVPSSKPPTPANDSFAALVASNKPKAPGSGLSLQERQKQLQEEKQREEAERRRQYDTTFGGADSQHWDTLGSGKSTPQPSAFGVPPPSNNPFAQNGLSKTINKPFAGLDTTSTRRAQSPSEDDLLAAFNSAVPVDNSSHFPIPTQNSGRSTPAYSQNVSRRQTPLPQPSSSHNAAMDDDDDDMFGLKQMAQKSASPAPPISANDSDDDILGLLSKPVSEFQTKEEPAPTREQEAPEDRTPSPGPQNAHDKAVAEMVDMGFPAEKSAIALATTESGLDVQAAVGWLLNQAHAEAKNKSKDRSQDRSRMEETQDRPRRGNSRPGARDDSREARANGRQPAWMREDARSTSGQRRQDGHSQEKDVTQMASEIGSTLFKSANSLWKTGRKQVQKAMADLNQEGDPNVPKWMRDAQAAENASKSSRSSRAEQVATDEAMMLEAGGRPEKSARTRQSRPHDDLPVRQRREQGGASNGTPDRMSSQSPAQRHQPPPSLDKRPATRLTRQEVEEQSSQAYISPARRKKATPQPQVDLFSPEPVAPAQSFRQSTPSHSNNPFLQTVPAPKAQSPAAKPTPPRPKVPPRQIPPVSPSALRASASDRQRGSEAFKRGDFAAAHTAYSAALSPLPQSHPVTIIVLCNRAVTNIKVGDPKAAIADADAALAIIGVSKGEGEKIVTGGAEGDKDMKEFYGKALMRKAEALENMEKWSEAHQVWKEAVQNGVGGAISISGRNRCEKAANGGNAAAQAKRPAPVRKPAPKPSALSDLGGGSTKDSEAVKRMKAANAAADRVDDEKFALTDQVDAKLIAWKGTKSDNLRALLGSLDQVLWEEAGWKKVNMGDLVMPNKVKIIYMKAIAKVHPDKLSQTATTEQKMISAAVFATLNEAWDKFKADNSL